MAKKRALISVAILVALSAVVGGYPLYRSVTDIGSMSGEPLGQQFARQDELARSYSIGVVSRFAPAIAYETYQPLIDYLNRVTPYTFRLRLSNSYEETVEQLAAGEVIAAFLGSYIYVQVRNELPIRPLLRPLNRDGEPFTRSALIVRRGSPLRSIEDLAGRSLALPSPSSFSGNWVTRMALREHGMSVDDLTDVQFFDYHHTVVFQVLWGQFDAGVVRESVAQEYLDKGIEVLASSPSFSGAPLVVHEEANSALVGELEAALLGIPASQSDQFSGDLASGFVRARSVDYDDLERLVNRMSKDHG